MWEIFFFFWHRCTVMCKKKKKERHCLSAQSLSRRQSTLHDKNTPEEPQHRYLQSVSPKASWARCQSAEPTHSVFPVKRHLLFLWLISADCQLHLDAPPQHGGDVSVFPLYPDRLCHRYKPPPPLCKPTPLLRWDIFLHRWVWKEWGIFKKKKIEQKKSFHRCTRTRIDVDVPAGLPDVRRPYAALEAEKS